MSESEFKIRPMVMGQDYPDVCEWWRARKFHYIPWDRLPRVKVICEKDGVKYAAAFLYFFEQGWAMLEFLVTNPKSPLKQRRAAIDATVQMLMDFARIEGCHTIWSSLENKNLIKLYEQHGFAVGDKKMTNMYARLS